MGTMLLFILASRIFSSNQRYILPQQLVGIGIGVNTSFTGAMVALGGPAFGLIVDNTKHMSGHHAGYLLVTLRFNQ